MCVGSIQEGSVLYPEPENLWGEFGKKGQKWNIGNHLGAIFVWMACGYLHS